ncbi:MAG: hypothetical protein WA151_06245 [Desulfatirhabdiaceae bacterium]
MTVDQTDRPIHYTPVLYRGILFPANQTIYSEWRLFDLRVRYSYDFFPSSPFILAGGGGAMLQHHIVKLEMPTPALKAEEDDHAVLPFLHLKLGFHCTDHISFYIRSDGGWIPESHFLDGGAYLNYRIGGHWDITAGYQYVNRDIDPGDVQNRTVQHLPHLAVAYRW